MLNMRFLSSYRESESSGNKEAVFLHFGYCAFRADSGFFGRMRAYGHKYAGADSDSHFDPLANAYPGAYPYSDADSYSGRNADARIQLYLR